MRAGDYIYIMKLLEQILSELGADDMKAFTVVPSFGAYFGSVKSVNEYSPEKIILLINKTAVTVRGEGLEIGKYFEQDIFIKGNVKLVEID